jgi:hypothetical protein
LVRGCLKGWVNLFDSGTGEEIEFSSDKDGGCAKNIWDIFPAWLIKSIMEYVKKISGLTSADELSLK